MEAYDIFKSLKNGYPFIYKTVNMGYKYIGVAVYRDCTEEEKNLFEDYWKEINRIHSLTYTPKEEDVSRLVKIFSKILDFGNSDYNDEQAESCSDKLWKCIQAMNPVELQSLIEQRDFFIEAFDYKDEAFYRHDKKIY